MPVRNINHSWWVDFRHDYVRYRVRSPENSRVGAVAYEAVLRQRAARGLPVRPERQTPATSFEAFAREWLESYVRVNNKPSEQHNKRVLLTAHLLPWFGRLRIDQITGQDVERYKAAKLDEGLAPKTINNHLAVLGRCLRTAQEWLGLDLVPRIRLLRVPPQQYDFLHDEEERSLLSTVADPFWRGMVLVALRTGLRVGELFGLDWTDVDLLGRVLTVRHSIVRGILGSPKSNKTRAIPLGDEVCETLRAWPHHTGLVFGHDGGRRPLRPDTAEKTLQIYSRKAGLRRIGWHVLRHTFASRVAASGTPPNVLQQLLGHSDIRTTMRYVHVMPGSLREAIQKLEPSRPALEPMLLGQQVGNERASWMP